MPAVEEDQDSDHLNKFDIQESMVRGCLHGPPMANDPDNTIDKNMSGNSMSADLIKKMFGGWLPKTNHFKEEDDHQLDSTVTALRKGG